MTLRHWRLRWVLFRVDRRDPDYGRLAGFAGRVQTLLTTPKIRTDSNWVSTLDLLLGVIYALIMAKREKFVDRAGPIEIAAIDRRSEQLAEGFGSEQTDRGWRATTSIAHSFGRRLSTTGCSSS